MSDLFHHSPPDLDGLRAKMERHGITEAIIKSLGKNNNDKNQIYSGVALAPLYPTFDMTFNLRGPSVSGKKKSATAGTPIPEAVFKEFSWVKADGAVVEARGVKMIIYAQYPETRLSGFQAVDNTMPSALSVDFTRRYPDAVRYLVLGRRGSGAVAAFMIVNPGPDFIRDVSQLPNAPGSRIWKQMRLKSAFNTSLFQRLAAASMIELPGARMASDGTTLPFNGTQVCGYTLEHSLGIRSNSSKFGDFDGIELKAHTQKKVTLFTPEPDMGLYSEDFEKFMKGYGYMDDEGHYRLTGVHKANVRCKKSGLTLKIQNYERGMSLASRADSDVHVGLYAEDGVLAAGWSLERLLNCWTAKHNEAVYVPATKKPMFNKELSAAGYRYNIVFSNKVMWCRETSAEKLFEALYSGMLFLDPAPKFCPGKPHLNKRRSQWRVNDIEVAARSLYNEVRFLDLHDDRSVADLVA